MKHLIGIRILTAVFVLAGAAALAFASGCAQQDTLKTAETDVAEPTLPASQPGGSGESVSNSAPRSDGSGEAQDTLIQTVFDGAAEDEFWLVEYGKGSAYSKESFRSCDTAAELKAALEADGSPLRLFAAPDGYELVSARVVYDCADGYKYELLGEETDDSGLKIKRYTIPEAGRFISCYELEYAGPDGKNFLVGGYLMRSMDTNPLKNETAESAAVDGMDEALLFRKTDGTGVRLEMRQSLAEPIVCVSSTSVAEMPPSLKDSPAFEEMTHVTILDACYCINADGMDGDALLALVS